MKRLSILITMLILTVAYLLKMRLKKTEKKAETILLPNLLQILS